MPKFFDTHSHLHFPQYDDDRSEVLARMQQESVWTIAVGTSLETSQGAVALANKHDGIWATIGVHPTGTTEKFDTHTYEALLGESVVGVGECGFDYFRTPREEVYGRQREIFEAQVDFAIEHDLPLMLHVRPSKGGDDAHDDALALLEEKQRTHGTRVRGNAHFFTASYAVAKRYWSLGFTTAIPGVVTFAEEMHEVVRQAPLDMLLSETDAPYAAPVPHRGGRNEPVYVAEVVKKIAELRGKELPAVASALVQNGVRVFGTTG